MHRLPAVWLIDSFGRRSLLLSTFPFMAIFQLFIAIAFAATGGSSGTSSTEGTDIKSNTVQTTLVLLGMYLFAVAYSPGEGPVPFVSPLHHPLWGSHFTQRLYRCTAQKACRFTTAILVGIPYTNKTPLHTTNIKTRHGTCDKHQLVLQLPSSNHLAFLCRRLWMARRIRLLRSLVCCWRDCYFTVSHCEIPRVTGILTIHYSVVPETRNMSLEQLAAVFSIPSRVHALFGLREAAWFIRKYFLRQKNLKRPVLVKMDDHPAEEDVDYFGGLERTLSIS